MFQLSISQSHQPSPIVYRLSSLIIALLLIVACSAPAPAEPPTPSARPAQLPLPEQPTDPPVATSVSGQGLPGRLIFATAGDLWIWEGEKARRLTTTGDAAQPALAPDWRVAFVRRTESASDLMLLDLGSGDLKQLTFYTPELPSGSIDRIYSSIWAFYPFWSPDGATLVFVSQYGPPFGSPASDYRLGLYSMPPQPGADRTMLYTDQAGQIGRSAYMPDGGAILFGLAPDAPGVAKIYRLDLTSGEVGDIPGMPEQSYDPAISPDGRLVAFTGRHAGGTDLFVLSLADGTSTQITNLGAARAPVFSPDGERLAFLASPKGERGFDLWTIELKLGGEMPSFTEPKQISFDLGIDPDSGLTWGT